MKKKLISMLLVASMAASMAVGCGGKEDPKDTSSNTDGAESTDKEDMEGKEGGSITFMAPDWAIPTDEQLKAFTDETGIEVVVNEVGWDDIRDKLVTAAAGGQAVADVVEVDWSWVGEFYAADWLEPLEVADDVKSDLPTLDVY